jgi:hypothetical protein
MSKRVLLSRSSGCPSPFYSVHSHCRTCPVVRDRMEVSDASHNASGVARIVSKLEGGRAAAGSVQTDRPHLSTAGHHATASERGGLPGVYVVVVPGLGPPHPSRRFTGAMRLRATRSDRRRPAINARNEWALSAFYAPGQSEGPGTASRCDSSQQPAQVTRPSSHVLRVSALARRGILLGDWEPLGCAL